MNQSNPGLKSDGRLFTNDAKANEKQPDYTGFITLTEPQLKKLVEQLRAGQEPKLQVAAWSRIAQSSGAPYQYLATEFKLPQQRQQQQGGGFRQQQTAPAQRGSSDEFGDDDIPF